MTSAFEKLARLAPWARRVTEPKPESLVARALRPAAERLADTRQVIEVDTVKWMEHHAALSHHLVYRVTKAAQAPADKAAEAEVHRAFALLQDHARVINGGADPVVLTKDGLHTIPFAELATARAKVQVLERERGTLLSIIEMKRTVGKARDA
ncbi:MULTISPECIES: hypothetical protein [unclassified Acidovorax]|uniref:hypothetical protein n=1 Tax=unclassified Acidovorax TaxID=2684926 RepID=UPI001C4628F9|nr:MULTISPECIES: hypothetical protein [unclassified Acidovorax]MBV7428090.1 hypothetical protein [Acidovorax sp. sif0732]MBV7449347.1 hypothetical protein [Acidovorax sp. sif0715]